MPPAVGRRAKLPPLLIKQMPKEISKQPRGSHDSGNYRVICSSVPETKGPIAGGRPSPIACAVRARWEQVITRSRFLAGSERRQIDETVREPNERVQPPPGQLLRWRKPKGRERRLVRHRTLHDVAVYPKRRKGSHEPWLRAAEGRTPLTRSLKQKLCSGTESTQLPTKSGRTRTFWPRV
jgi:hypothetical protein